MARALGDTPDADSRYNLALTLEALRRPADAAAILDGTLARHPDQYGAHGGTEIVH